MDDLLRRAAPLACAWAALACIPDVTLEPESVVGCEAPSDCPADRICQNRRCVPKDRVDTAAPASCSAPTVAPARGHTGTVFTFTAGYAEALEAPPTLAIDAGLDGRTVLASPPEGPAVDAQGCHLYRWSWTAAGVAEGARKAQAVGRDLAGNEATIVFPSDLVIDDTPPRVASTRLSDPLLAPGETATLTVTYAEAAPAGTLVSMLGPGGAAAEWVSGAPNGNDVEYTFTLDAAQGLENGAWRLVLDAEDDVGNRASRDDLAGLVITLDSTPPALARPPAQPLQPAYVRPTQPVSFTVLLSEPLATPPAVNAVGAGGVQIPLEVYLDAGRLNATGRLDAPGDMDGAYEVYLSEATDEAGNVAGPILIGALVIDGVAPPLREIVLERTRYSPVNGHRVVSVELVSDADLTVDGAVEVRVGERDRMQCDPFVQDLPIASAGGNPRSGHACTFTIGPGTPTGPLILEAAATDRAENVIYARATIENDVTPPDVATFAIDPPLVGLGGRWSLSLVATEPLADYPAVAWEQGPGEPPGFAWSVRQGPSAIGQGAVVAGAPSGTYRALVVDLVDTVGNRSTVSLVNPAPGAEVRRELQVDAGRPVLHALRAQGGAELGGIRAFSGHPDHRQLDVLFEVGEPLDGPPSVTVGARALACAPDDAMRLWTCSLAFCGRAPAPSLDPACATEPPEEEGLFPVVVRLRDPAGNETVDSSLLVQLDFSPPELRTLAFAPALARRGASVALQLAASETLGSAPVLEWGPTGDPGFDWDPAGASSRWEASLVVGAAQPAETYEVRSARLVDLLGNAVEFALAGVSLEVDPLPPRVLAPALSGGHDDGSGVRAFSTKAGYDRVTVEFEVDEALAAAPTVELGGRAAARVGESTLPYRYELTVCGAEGAGKPGCAGVAETDGVLPVVIRAVDVAGNEAVDGSRLVRLDFTPPAVAPGSVDISRTPPAGSLVATVTALAAGASAQVRFSTTEPASGATRVDPPLVVATSPGALPVTALASTATGFAYRLDVPATGAVAEGPYVLRATMQDRVGNEGSVVLDLPAPGIYVDTTPPAPMPVGTPGKVLFRRMPWGADETGGVPEYYLAIEPGVVEPEATVFVWAGATLRNEKGDLTAIPIGRGQARSVSTGGPRPVQRTVVDPIRLSRIDRQQVYVSQVDAAGNVDAQAATKVLDVEWTATMGDAEASAPASTHALEARPVFSGLRNESTKLESAPVAVTDRPRLARADFASATTANVLRAGMTPRSLAPAAGWDYPVNGWEAYGDYFYWDSKRGLVGNFPNMGTGANPWSWDGATWIRPAPLTDPEGDGNPSTYNGWVTVYDEALDEAIGWTACCGGDYEAHTRQWRWRGTSWKQLSVPDPESDGNPPSATGHNLVYDPDRRATWLVVAGTTWTWNGVSWRRIPTATTPSRFLGGIAYDRTRKVTVAFEGNVAWEFDGTDWRRVAPTDPEGDGNPGSVGPCTWDPNSGGVISGPHEINTGVVWVWNGASWRKIVPIDPEGDGNLWWPSTATKVYNPRNNRVVVHFGFQCCTVRFAETWEWTGRSWIRRQATGAAPDPRTGHASAYDADRRRVVMFGGLGASSLAAVGAQTWELREASYVAVTPTDPESDGNPSPRHGHALAYDTARKRTLLFAGANPADAAELAGDLWSFDGTSWARANPADPESDGNPAARAFHAAAFDVARGRLVVFGGATASGGSAETWEWNGASWRLAATAGPPALARAAMAYDARRGVSVLFGGTVAGTPSADTWEWDGTVWRKAAPASVGADGLPPARSRHALVYDAAREAVWLYGGEGASGRLSDLWLYEGSRWAKVLVHDDEADGSSAARAGHAMAYDAERGKLAVFGGDVSAGVSRELWDIVSPPDRPGHVFSVYPPAAPAALAPTPTLADAGVSLEDGRFVSLAVRFVAGAEGFDRSTPGVALWGWAGSRYELLAGSENAAPFATPAEAGWFTTSAAVARAFQYGVGGSLAFAVAARGTNARGPARIATDYAHVRIRYRVAP